MKSQRRKLTLAYTSAGFTLIELLIVIVIIAILAGLVIGVLNPVQQQNRARDATVQSSITKAALAAKSLYVSAPRTTNKMPTLNEFINGVGNVAGGIGGTETCSTSASADNVTATVTCTYALQGINLPSSCNATALYNGDPATDSTQCRFAYYRTGTLMRIAAMGAARPERLFVYEVVEDAATGNVTEAYVSCPTTEDITAATLSANCTTIQ